MSPEFHAIIAVAVALSERVARLDGLVEGLRDAVTGKAA